MKKKSLEKIGICCGSRGVGPYGPFCLGIFRHINILGFILYSDVLCNYPQIHSETFSFAHGFFSARVSSKYDVFLCFVFHHRAIDFNT